MELERGILSGVFHGFVLRGRRDWIGLEWVESADGYMMITSVLVYWQETQANAAENLRRSIEG